MKVEVPPREILRQVLRDVEACASRGIVAQELRATVSLEPPLPEGASLDSNSKSSDESVKVKPPSDTSDLVACEVSESRASLSSDPVVETSRRTSRGIAREMTCAEGERTPCLPRIATKPVTQTLGEISHRIRTFHVCIAPSGLGRWSALVKSDRTRRCRVLPQAHLRYKDGYRRCALLHLRTTPTGIRARGALTLPPRSCEVAPCGPVCGSAEGNRVTMPSCSPAPSPAPTARRLRRPRRIPGRARAGSSAGCRGTAGHR